MTQLKLPINNTDHIQGSSKAPIELVEYGDYQCPHCGHAYPIIKSIQKKLGADLKFVFRNFPLSEIHPDAFGAALAAEAAGLQNKYWEMHDIIFENQATLNPQGLVHLAKKIGLDINLFKIDIQKAELTNKIETDFESGVRSGVNGTPSFFINGQKYNGDWEEQPFTQHLKGLLSGRLI